MADREIPYEDLPPFLQMMEDWEREKRNPSFSRSAPRAPVEPLSPEVPLAAPASARPVAQARTVPAAAPRVPPRPPRRLPSADPRRDQGGLL
ncbi:hypothetical protein [Methylobacterium sp. MA0201]|uniref:hypothetical protein n=1 Tax=Methylobacterium alsaeris TaxID=3344826 RepID=UPI0037563360